MEKLTRYFELQNEIYAYFGYTENWRAIPLDDQRGVHWMLVASEENGVVVWSDRSLSEDVINSGDDLYSGQIYTQRHLSKWVYRGPEFTMISVDTGTDGNKFLMVFDNARECHDASLKAMYSEAWGAGL